MLNIPSETAVSNATNPPSNDKPKTEQREFNNSFGLQTREEEVNLEYLDKLDNENIETSNRSLGNTDITMRDQVLPEEQFSDLVKEFNETTSTESNFSRNITFASTAKNQKSTIVLKTEIIQENSSKVNYIPIAWGVGFGQIAIMVLVAILYVKNTRRREQSKANKKRNESSNLEDNETT